RLRALAADEWLVVDGVLSDSAALSEHPRALGVVKSHGAHYFEGTELERALTLPDGHRSGVFRPRARGAGRDIYSWYVRLWPWEGNDLLYGLLRLGARGHPDTLALAAPIEAWALAQAAPHATPARRRRQRAEAGDPTSVPLLGRERDEHRDGGDCQSRGARGWGLGARCLRRRDGRVRVLGPRHAAARRGGCRGRPGQGRGESDGPP